MFRTELAKFADAACGNFLKIKDIFLNSGTFWPFWILQGRIKVVE
jgi:hypothetical protein